MKARALARMARRARRLHQREQRVAIAVDAQRPHGLHVAAGFALVPLFAARAAPQVQLAGLARALQRLLVHIGERQHLAAAPVLHHARHEAIAVVFDLRVDAIVRRCAHPPIVGHLAPPPGFRQTAAMQSLLDSKLVVITGKGGVGKTTIAAAVGLLAAESGRRAIVVELGQESRLPGLFGTTPARPGLECRLAERLSSISIDPDRALLEWLQALGGRVSGRVLASSGTFQYFAAAAPGAKELVTMVKIWQLTCGGARGSAGAGGAYDLVVLDAPATGHALGLLGSPYTFGAIARVGPIAGHTRQVQELLESPSQTAYLAVALATEMAVTEVLELQAGLQRQLGRELAAVLVNALLPRRFTVAELQRIESLDDDGASSGAGTDIAVADATLRRAVTAAAVHAARAIHDRAGFEHSQLARLRRRGFEVVGVPFVWEARLELAAVEGIARGLARRL